MSLHIFLVERRILILYDHCMAWYLSGRALLTNEKVNFDT